VFRDVAMGGENMRCFAMLRGEGENMRCFAMLRGEGENMRCFAMLRGFGGFYLSSVSLTKKAHNTQHTTHTLPHRQTYSARKNNRQILQS